MGVYDLLCFNLYNNLRKEALLLPISQISSQMLREDSKYAQVMAGNPKVGSRARVGGQLASCVADPGRLLGQK